MIRVCIRRSWPVAALAGVLCLAGCRPVEHEAVAPEPTPEASPTPLYVPYKRLDTGRLFNGVTLETSFSMESGTNATAEVASPSSYSLRLELRVRVPRAVTTGSGLAALNPALPVVFPKLEEWMSGAQVSPLYERLYRHKVQAVQQSLTRLDQLLPRHDFFDCETMLEIEVPVTKRKVLWIQSAMDVDSDGSDSDRVPGVDANSETFQPLTSYKWPKRGANPNPFVAEHEAHLVALEGSLGRAATAAQREQIKEAIEGVRTETRMLKASSFLVAATDPYIVAPFSIVGQKDDAYSPGVGDYCAVVYGNMIYPAIIGDVGPSIKVGEASLRIAKELNARATSENRPVSALKISYLIFPGTAERPFGPPDLAHWHDRVDALLKEAGGYAGTLFVWKDLTAPPPTPTPSPVASVTPGVIISGTGTPEVSGTR
jgi:hypothetical protein